MSTMRTVARTDRLATACGSTGAPPSVAPVVETTSIGRQDELDRGRSVGARGYQSRTADAERRELEPTAALALAAESGVMELEGEPAVGARSDRHEHRVRTPPSTRRPAGRRRSADRLEPVGLLPASPGRRPAGGG